MKLKKVTGVSLVELMVALLLGSLIAVAATQLFLVNQQTNNLQAGLSFVQDQGRYAFNYISKDLMQAGYSDQGNQIAPFVFTEIVTGWEVSDDDVDPRFDRLVYRVEGGANCSGGSFSGIKVYEVDGTGLKCKTRWWNPNLNDGAGGYTENSAVVVDNVMAFQVVYGVDTDELGDSGYGLADYYTNADDIAPATDKVVSVRYALLIASDRVVNPDAATYAPNDIRVLDQTYDSDDLNFADGRAYRVYTSTVGVRNLGG